MLTQVKHKELKLIGGGIILFMLPALFSNVDDQTFEYLTPFSDIGMVLFTLGIIMLVLKRLDKPTVDAKPVPLTGRQKVLAEISLLITLASFGSLLFSNYLINVVTLLVLQVNFLLGVYVVLLSFKRNYTKGIILGILSLGLSSLVVPLLLLGLWV